jgi:hypothetical protein
VEQGRLYRRTNSGRKALESERSGLPAAYRNILEMLETERTAAELVIAMRGVFSDRQVLAWLDELDTLCFIEALNPGEAVVWPHQLAGAALQAR